MSDGTLIEVPADSEHALRVIVGQRVPANNETDRCVSIPANTTIYWHTEPTDMRKGIDGLSGIVRGQ